MIKIGLTETLTFISGYALGSVTGFVTGSSIIVISDMALIAGVWTPFIALIIGTIGAIGGIVRRFVREPTFELLGISAVLLTLMSESLQNVWVAIFYNLPLYATMFAGLPTLIAALANNVVLFTAVAGRIIKVIKDSSVSSE